MARIKSGCFAIQVPLFLYSSSRTVLMTSGWSSSAFSDATMTKHGQGVGTSPTLLNKHLSTSGLVVYFSQRNAFGVCFVNALMAPSRFPMTSKTISPVAQPFSLARRSAIRWVPEPILLPKNGRLFSSSTPWFLIWAGNWLLD